ncbi:MAG: lactoylglutathione lyase [Candidatus Schekmanbacteria bacterium RBG_13_48_7]|uniref:Lactoylglutathione lyase n=1 Tax=Candidatus Schekmanbacteria bacterium RBG_13_48_7 TaxID=1817878 RepID=A0A1F7RM45_9BACT|nr:MAG: lactoylglutathione lyase [Candidatus Schekmanbacteria bacterium RBG_13_48_7]
MNKFKNAISWFEIPVTNFERALTFYNKIFDYDMYTQKMGPHMMGFFPCEKDGLSGAIVHGEGCIPSKTGTCVYLNGGDNLNNILDKVEEAGGKIAVKKTLITNEIGYFAIFIDTEGNKVALHSLH